jgi:hypothetical protein
MDTTITKAKKLLAEWSHYKNLHYSQKTKFDYAVDIELEKEACNRLVQFLQEGLLDNSCSESELVFRANLLENHLRIFKDRITFELLKNG